MTWIGSQQLYRIALVWCHTYVKEPLPILCSMTILSIVIAFTTVFVRPYNKNPANNASILSCAGTVCIAVVNLTKAEILSVNHHLVLNIIGYMDVCENILLTWLPVAEISLWVFYVLIK